MRFSRKTITLLAALGLALLLSACEITIKPLPDPPAVSQEMGTGSFAAPVTESLGNLRAGESVLVRVKLSSNQLDADMLHLELNRNLRLELQRDRRDRQLLAVSVTGNYFARSSAALASAASDLAPAAIQPRERCLGSCILYRPESSFVVKVTNNSDATMDGVTLTAFVEEFADEYEASGNDTIGGAVDLSGQPGDDIYDSGAIELLGDVDYWYINRRATVVFHSPLGLVGVEAVHVDLDGVERELLRSGEDFTMPGPGYLKVSSHLDRAGIAHGQASLYQLEVFY